MTYLSLHPHFRQRLLCGHFVLVLCQKLAYNLQHTFCKLGLEMTHVASVGKRNPTHAWNEVEEWLLGNVM